MIHYHTFLYATYYQLSIEIHIFRFKMGLICECFDVNVEWNKTGEQEKII